MLAKLLNNVGKSLRKNNININKFQKKIFKSIEKLLTYVIIENFSCKLIFNTYYKNENLSIARLNLLYEKNVLCNIFVSSSFRKHFPNASTHVAG